MHVRVYILHTVAHAPFSCLSGSNILFVFLIVSVCSRVNRRLNEKGRGEGGRGNYGRKEDNGKGWNQGRISR